MPTAIIIPDGTPAWISQELIQETLRVWQPFYAVHLTTQDAIEMITNVGRMYDVLSRDSCHEAVCCTGTGEQS